MRNHIYIRADGNETIATGHIMRCLSIAEQIREMGTEVTFIVSDDRSGKLITSRGFAVVVLGTVWNKLNWEIEKICTYMKEHNVEVLLVDSYFVTEEYLQEISQYAKIVYIDDLYSFAYPVDTVINYGAFADQKLYENMYQVTNKKPHFLIGSRYVPLRTEFALQPYKVQKKVRKILITTGGTDQLNVAGNILISAMEALELMELEYHVIIGCFNQNKEMLYTLAERYSNICLHENVNNMSEWMRSCDIAVSAAGTTIYELCASGIPSVCLEVADNQEGAIIWEKMGYMIYAGNVCKDKKKCMERCVEALIFYKNNYEERKRKSIYMQSLVDGYGAKRIAKYIVDNSR